MHTIKWSIILLTILFSIGCMPQTAVRGDSNRRLKNRHYKLHLIYQTHGDVNPANDKAVEDRFQQSLDIQEDKNIRVFLGTLPEGIGNVEDGLMVKEGYEHKILGTFRFVHGDYLSYPKHLEKEHVVGHIRRVAQAAGGNVVLMSYLYKWGKSVGASGIIIKLDPKLDLKTLKTHSGSNKKDL